MRILYHPQYSMRSYEDNRWLVSSDAQFTKIISYVHALPQDWRWFFISPEDTQAVTDYKNMVPNNVTLLRTHFGDNVLENRYAFDMKFAKEQLMLKAPDVILCEVPEHVRAWRVAQERTKMHCPIIAMVEHVDIYEQTKVSEAVSYTPRQLDGYAACDMMAFPLEGMRQEWAKWGASYVGGDQAADLFHPEFGQFWDKSVVWDALYSPIEVENMSPFGDRPESRPECPVINFISRLSDNQRTHYQEFFKAVELLADDECFHVWVANPNGAMRWHEICQAMPKLAKEHRLAWIGETPDTKTRQDYLYSLWKSDIVPILYPLELIYSLGHCEAITANNLIVTTYDPRGGTDTMTGAIKIQPEVDVNELAAALKVAMQMVGNQVGSFALAQQKDWLVRSRSVEHNIERVLATIEEVTAT